MTILSSIHSPEDLRALDKRQLPALCEEIRAFLIDNVSKTGGHLASNLGAVELTVALHRVYDTSRDRVVFDVGHQCYVHKMLTGRMDEFPTLRKLDGLSGFPRPSESIHDAAVSGHASNSVSVALGMARARTLMHDQYSVAAVIGDGAMTGGLAFEGLSNAAQSGEPMVVILNDNGMAIDGNVGGMASIISHLHLKPRYLSFKRKYRATVGKIKPLYNMSHRLKEKIKNRFLPRSMFESMGFMYFGPIDGHDLEQMEAVFTWAKEQNRPVLVHVVTQKGKGYSYAEDDPEAYHGVDAFDEALGVDKSEHTSFSSTFGHTMEKLANLNTGVCAITAAMCSGTGLQGFAQKYPARFFDVGITEGNAAAMAAGMAKQGLKPVFAVYSSFLQRSYDMLIHDVALSKLHVVLAVDRAGLVGRDGCTHQGLFDVAYLTSVPNMTVYSPASYAELSRMLTSAVLDEKGPVAIRYPRGGEGEYRDDCGEAPATRLREGGDITLVGYGVIINNLLAAARILEQQSVSAEIIKLNRIAPLDASTVIASAEKTGRVLTIDETCAAGSVGEQVLAALAQAPVSLVAAERIDLGEGVIPQGGVSELESRYGLDAQSIADRAAQLCKREAREQ